MNCDRSLSNVGGYYHLQIGTQGGYREMPQFPLHCQATISAPGLKYKPPFEIERSQIQQFQSTHTAVKKDTADAAEIAVNLK